jgi:hypothetical protein
MQTQRQQKEVLKDLLEHSNYSMNYAKILNHLPKGERNYDGLIES